MYNSFLLIFHNHLHLIIDLSLICNAHYSYELRMFFISHYRSSTGKDRSCNCCCGCVNQEPEPGEKHRCRARSTSLPWECSRTEIASPERALTYAVSACQQSEGHVSCYLFNCAVTASSSMSLPVLTRMTNCRKSSDC